MVYDEIKNAKFHFIIYYHQDKILSEQAERERAEPLLPTVDPVLEGKQLFTCQMAADDFRCADLT